MQGIIFKAGVLFMLLVLPAHWVAEACSPARDYIRHSSFEMVDLADAIVVAEPIEAVKGSRYGSDLRFKIIRHIKGNAPETLEISFAYFGDVEPSDPKEISQPHPNSLGGQCNRAAFAKNTKYVLFLKQAEDGSWRRFGGPFTRNGEDYHGPESYWARAIGIYLDIQNTPDRMAQLEALYPFWKARNQAQEGSFARALGEDINIHLWSLSWRKPTPYLIKVYEGLEAALEGRPPAPELRGYSILDALTGDAERGLAPVPEENLHRSRLSLLRQLHLGDHAGATALVSRIAANDPSPEELSSAILFFNATGQREQGLALFHKYGWVMAVSGSKIESDLIYEAALSFHPAEDETSDTEYLNWWAENAFALYQMRRARFGGDSIQRARFLAEVLRPEDYRERPNVSLALARDHDEDVILWADAEITRLIELGALNDEALQLPVRILLEGFFVPETQKVRRLLCHSSVTRLAAVKAYGLLIPDYGSLDLLKYIANAPLEAEEREALVLSVMAHIGRVYTQEAASRSRKTKLDDYTRYLDRIIAGKSVLMPARAKPLSCAVEQTPN